MKNDYIKRTLTAVFAAFMVAVAGVAGANDGAPPVEGWHVNLNVVAGGNYEHMMLGAHVSADDGRDGMDAPAWLVGYLSAYFYEPSWTQGPYFWNDIRSVSLPQEWTFYISARYRDVKVHWKLSEAPVSIDLELVDDMTGTAINMRSRSSYVYSNRTTSPRRFRIIASGSFTPTGGEPLPEEPEVPADTTPPETEITTGVPEYTASRDVSVSFAGTDDVTEPPSLLFSYSVDGGDWSAYSGVATADLTGLLDGPHSFKVKAKDEAGNEDPTPAEVSFSVDTTAPSLALYTPSPATLWPPNGKRKAVRFSGVTSDIGSGIGSVTYTLTDEYGEHSTSGALAVANLSLILNLTASRDGGDFDGRVYTLTVVSTDMVGNESVRSVTLIVPHDQGR